LSSGPNSIFISYSHKDSKLIMPIVRLLRGTKDIVFRDDDNLRPGRKWKPQIKKAILETSLFVLIWCRHSKRSKEVRKEFEFALNLKKNILPVLLDRAKLPDELREFEWVDFRKISRYSHRSILALIKFGFFILSVISLGFLAIISRACRVEAPPLKRPVPFLESTDFFILLILFLSLSIIIVFSVVRYKRRKKSNKKMAQGMYEEIIKRSYDSKSISA
jgi:hypothetical protein